MPRNHDRAPGKVAINVSASKQLKLALEVRSTILNQPVSKIIVAGIEYLNSIKWAGVPYYELNAEDAKRYEHMLKAATKA